MPGWTSLDTRRSIDIHLVLQKPNGRLEISAAVSFLDWLFRGGAAAPACRPAADCNGNRDLSVIDAVYALLHLFGGGAPPPVPFPDCGMAADPAEICSNAPDSCRV